MQRVLQMQRTEKRAVPMEVERPGLAAPRLIRLMEEAVTRCGLDLRGVTVLTEAASGSYVVTPLIAALAGARQVFAIARDSRFGSAEAVALNTMDLAARMGVSDRIEIVPEKSRAIVGRADIITNSGHVRPLDRLTISWMKPGAVIALMYEAWEHREADLSLKACRERDIQVAGVNERYPAVDVFSYLGILAVQLLLGAGVAVYSSRVLVLCDNPFAPYLKSGLQDAGAEVILLPPSGFDRGEVVPARSGPFDAILVALQPGAGPVLSQGQLQDLARHSPGAVLAQYWGDLDRGHTAACGLGIWPPREPAPGHMAILLSDLGPEPVVRLQSGGLKAAHVLMSRPAAGSPDYQFVQPL